MADLVTGRWAIAWRGSCWDCNRTSVGSGLEPAQWVANHARDEGHRTVLREERSYIVVPEGTEIPERLRSRFVAMVPSELDGRLA